MGYKGTIPFIFIAVIKLFGQTEKANEMQEIRSDGQIDTLYFEFKPIHVTAYPLNNTNLNVPLSVSAIGKKYFQYGQKQSALNEALQPVPGLFAMNAENFSQDLRIAIRGFGARAPFGIRGIRILVDGIPETTPDKRYFCFFCFISPNLKESNIAIGLAPIVKMSLKIPPTPVAAP